MSTPPYATPVHLNLRVSLASPLRVAMMALATIAIIACGGDAGLDVDQLVHEGPTPSPRDGELSARLAATDGRVVDLATDGDLVWVAAETSGGASVTAIGPRGIAWSRPVYASQAVADETLGPLLVAPLTGAAIASPVADDAEAPAVAVFAGPDWWSLGPDGGVLWRAPGRDVLQTWPTDLGMAVVTGAGPQRSLWHLTAKSVDLVATYPVDDALLAPGRDPGDAPRALSLRDGELVVRSLDRADPAEAIPLEGHGLAAVLPLPSKPGALALLLSEPPRVAVLSSAPHPRVVVHPLPAPIASTRAFAVHQGRLLVATTVGIGAFDVTIGEDGVRLSVPAAFDGADLAAPLAGPP